MTLKRFGHTLAEVEREHILETLACCNGNRTRTAKFLDISIRCLRMKLHQFGQSGRRVPPESPSALADDLLEARGEEPRRSPGHMTNLRAADFQAGLLKEEAKGLRALLRDTEAADLFAPSVRHRIGETVAAASRVARIKVGSALWADQDPQGRAA